MNIYRCIKKSIAVHLLQVARFSWVRGKTPVRTEVIATHKSPLKGWPRRDILTLHSQCSESEQLIFQHVQLSSTLLLSISLMSNSLNNHKQHTQQLLCLGDPCGSHVEKPALTFEVQGTTVVQRSRPLLLVARFPCGLSFPWVIQILVYKNWQPAVSSFGSPKFFPDNFFCKNAKCSPLLVE